MYTRASGIYDERVVEALKIWSRCFPSLGSDVSRKLGDLFPTVYGEIRGRVDTPLVLVLDGEANKYYIGCNANRVEGERYRSPYTDKCYYSLGGFDDSDTTKEQGTTNETVLTLDSAHLKMLETEFHGVYENYCKYYSTVYDGTVNEDLFDHGILLSNVYCYDLSGDSFGACFAMKHILNPFGGVDLDDDAREREKERLVYYLDIIHNVETIISHKLGISTYRISSVYYYGFSNDEGSVKYDGCKTNWLEKKYEFSTLKFAKSLRKGPSNAILNVNSNIALERNSITIVNSQTLYFHLLNIGRLIESIDNSVMKHIQNVCIDNLINISNDLRNNV
ncbi:F-actin capping protein [Cryptosporidium ryanae]|uniref:F-actin capping protein n=1 Tax=Cryptosporidium ryanae TaxID=515981 RepID=UPI00351A2A1E|nr:F-actin capping protein [Cryptosporidium ryanae]